MSAQVAVDLIYEGALNRWPSLTREEFNEAGMAVAASLGEGGSASVQDMAVLIEAKLKEMMEAKQ